MAHFHKTFLHLLGAKPLALKDLISRPLEKNGRRGLGLRHIPGKGRQCYNLAIFIKRGQSEEVLPTLINEILEK